MSYRLQFIDSAKFMASFLSHLADGILEIKYKFGHDNKKCEFCGIKYKDCNCFLEYTNFENNLVNRIQMFLLQQEL